MRSSSIKTLVFVVTLVFTLAAAAPSAMARPAQPKRTAPAARKVGIYDRAQLVVRVLLQRFGFNVNGLPSDPIPGQDEEEGAGLTGLPSDPIPSVPAK